MTKKERQRLLTEYRTAFPYDPEGNAQQSIQDKWRFDHYVPDRVCSIRQDILAGAYSPERRLIFAVAEVGFEDWTI